MPRPEFLVMDVQEALMSLLYGLEEMTRTLGPESHELDGVVAETAILVDAWRDFLRLRDPEGWERARKELLKLEAKGKVRNLVDHAWLAQAGGPRT